MCGIVVKLMSDQGYSEEQIDRLIGIISFNSLVELPDNLTKYRDYVIKKTMERHAKSEQLHQLNRKG